MLINADSELASHGIKFVRYVDDYRLFTKSRQAAYEAMQILDHALRREGLFLNSGKTSLIDLAAQHHEEEVHTAEFEQIDIDHQETHTKVIRSRYGSKIAKYYKFPGQEAIKRFQKIDLGLEFAEVSKPDATEDSLKSFVKAAIYRDDIEFSWIGKIVSVYPHLIPYAVDAITKEFQTNPARITEKFKSDAIVAFRRIFETYKRSDYFRIQAARLLCQLDPKCGQFLGARLAEIGPRHEIVFPQIVQFLGARFPRPKLLEIISRYHNYGAYARTSLALNLQEGLVLKDDERSATMKNLQKAELDPLFAKNVETLTSQIGIRHGLQRLE